MGLRVISKFNKAFSLIEVLITVAILATAVIFLFRSFGSSLAAARFSQDITLATYSSENKLWEIEQVNLLGKNFALSGTEKIQNKDFNWNYIIEIDPNNPNLKQLNFVISWKEKAKVKEYSMEFSTYLP